MNEFILAGFFCKKCYNFIDGSLYGKLTTCPHCDLKLNLKGGAADELKAARRRKQQPGRR